MSTAASSVHNSTNVRFSFQALWSAAVPATLRALARLSPAAGARLALALWVRPRRHAVPEREEAWVASARPIEVGGQPAWEWGRGPTVLLVHGWEGRGSQMGAIGTALAASGYRAVAVDLPGHGRASGRTAHLGSAAAALSRVVDALGPVRAVVAHSFGAAVASRVIDRGAWTERLVLVAPADPSQAIARYTRWLGLAPEVARRMEDALAVRAGVHPCEVTPEALAGGLRMPGLVVHAPDDPMVPWVDGAAYAAHWPAARLVSADGLGHLRILRDEAVVARVVDFVTEPQRERRIAQSRS